MTLASAYKLSPKPLFSPKERLSGSTKAASPSTSPIPTSAVVALSEDDSASSTRGSKVFNSVVDRKILSSSIFAPSRSITKLIIDKSKRDDSLDSLKNQDLLSPKKQVSFRFDVSKSDIGITSSPIKNGSSNVVDFLKDDEPEELPESPSTDIKKETKAFSEIIEEEIEIPDGFWTSPSFDQIKSMSAMELRAVKDFTVGQKGFGSIKFLEPVDLTSISLQSIPEIVVFSSKSCVVYPNAETKPPIGEGFNKRARVTLDNCFPLSKDTKLPISDPKHPIIRKHIRKLKSIPKTTFEEYDPITGTWVFSVAHF
ncbi:unnamed protein product [[Candida] boidinii]|nr:unnamed protein product [[Candida] boidinii]